MRWLFWLLLILALAVGAALLTTSNQGYVLIVRPPYRLELSLNLLLVLVVLAFAALHLSLRFIHYTRRLPASVRAYKEEQRLKSGFAALRESLHAMAEGHYAAAQKAAARAFDLGEDPVLSALIAARASHKLKQKTHRDYYLAEAEQRAPDKPLGRMLMQAELLLDDGQYSSALEVLQRLKKIEANHPAALRLELKLHTRLNNWQQALSILQELKNDEVIDAQQAKEMRLVAHRHLLQRYADDLPALTDYWRRMSEEDQLDLRLAYHAANSFIGLGAHMQALEIIEKSLTQQWDSELVGLLGDCISTNPQKLLQQAEGWLLQHEGDAKLLLSLGNICSRMQLWGKAESYLDASISVKPSAAAHLALAKVLEHRGEKDRALYHYRQSVQEHHIQHDL
ncbi:MAG TPA: heme biosynthesis HemY N-terminal domain-containing protein [Methylophilaceae bacterium]|nr:heme biosynthesis HemY N-terminal domain-containing protein [Methylophilaceae bacterium]